MIRTVRALERIVPAWDLAPAQERLVERDLDEAYAAAKGDAVFAVYFPRNGAVGYKAPPGEYELRWIEVDAARELPSETRRSEGTVRLETPTDGHWLAIGVRR